MAQLACDTARCGELDLEENELVAWFRGGRELASLPERAQRLLRPLLLEAGFDLAKPIHPHKHEGTPGVTLYQEPGATQASDHRAPAASPA